MEPSLSNLDSLSEAIKKEIPSETYRTEEIVSLQELLISLSAPSKARIWLLVLLSIVALPLLSFNFTLIVLFRLLGREVFKIIIKK